jgi:hypothetical protein
LSKEAREEKKKKKSSDRVDQVKGIVLVGAGYSRQILEMHHHFIELINKKKDDHGKEVCIDPLVTEFDFTEIVQKVCI